MSALSELLYARLCFCDVRPRLELWIFQTLSSMSQTCTTLVISKLSYLLNLLFNNLCHIRLGEHSDVAGPFVRFVKPWRY